jgi:hypothetical protein
MLAPTAPRRADVQTYWHPEPVTALPPDDDAELDDGSGDPELDPRVRKEAEARHALGSWRQDREANRRKVLRSLIGLVVIVLASALLAYGCSVLRGPAQVHLADEVSGFVLLPAGPQEESLRGRFEAAGAIGPAAGTYRGTSDVLVIAGFGSDLPVEVLGSLLPDTSDEAPYEGRGGTLTCGPTADGSRCLWKGAEIVGGTVAKGLPPQALADITRDLRAGAVRS